MADTCVFTYTCIYSLSGATQAEGQLTEVTATDVKAISTGRSQIIFANGVEVRKITCADDTTITSKSKHPLNGALLCSNFDKDGYITEKVHVIDKIMNTVLPYRKKKSSEFNFGYFVNGKFEKVKSLL